MCSQVEESWRACLTALSAVKSMDSKLAVKGCSDIGVLDKQRCLLLVVHSLELFKCVPRLRLSLLVQIVAGLEIICGMGEQCRAWTKSPGRRVGEVGGGDGGAGGSSGTYVSTSAGSVTSAASASMKAGRSGMVTAASGAGAFCVSVLTSARDAS